MAALAVFLALVELAVAPLQLQDKLRIVESCSCQGRRLERRAEFGQLVAEVRHQLAGQVALSGPVILVVVQSLRLGGLLLSHAVP